MKKLTERQVDALLKKQKMAVSKETHVSKEAIHKEIACRQTKPQTRLKKQFLSVASALGILFIIVNGAALATGHQPFNVIVHFSHILKNGSAGSGYSLNSPVLQGSDDPSPSSQQKHKQDVGSTAASTSGAVTANNLKVNNYNHDLDQFIGMSYYPKMNMNSIGISSINAFVVNKQKGIFYMFVDGYIKGTNKDFRLDLYHNVPGNIQMGGQTDSSHHKQQIDLSGIKATYVSFTNKGSNTDYIVWKDGNWTIVLHSMNVSKKQLVKYAKEIENQANKN